MSKYKPLSDRLSQHEADDWSVSFAELEDVLGFPLPKAARDQNAWWLGGEKPHHDTWKAQGWRVETVDRNAQTVVFRRYQAAEMSEPTPMEAAMEAPTAAETPTARKGVVTAAVAGGAAALLAGGVSVLASFLAKRKGEPWR
ncbi:hypothetical protein [Phenylobacterium sp.]|uniref:DUF7662 domain-containing protein n=1 Tax=Phenylobacterium sp. TaxID=1871053 RepID=UPI002731C3E8|nr:hypothetical protein [Phenylobacterium sp.]MDP1618780.1 hypothetical protein [Phenylobacterium sp.]MDP1989050.1 hypothetical protein [Phenylobacterium sp.]